MSAADSPAWADRLRVVLANRDPGAIRSMVLNEGEEDWIGPAYDGLQEPTMAQYARLAVHLEVPLAVLTGSTPAERNLAIALRAGLLEASADVSLDVERANALIEHARLLLSWFPAQDADFASAVSVARRASSSLPFMKDAGRQAAENLRALWNLPDEQPLGDLALRIEALGVPVECRRLPSGVHGMTVHDESTERWTAVVFVSTADWWTRQRYSLAHELCHLIYRDSQPVIVDRNEEESTDLSEVRAEAFARHLLLPENALRGVLRRAHGSDSELVADIMLSYGVSRTVALRALKDAGWDDDRAARVDEQSTSVNDLMTQAGRIDEWQALCADQGEFGASRLLLELALHAYREALVPADAVAEVLHRPTNIVTAELAAQGWTPEAN